MGAEAPGPANQSKRPREKHGRRKPYSSPVRDKRRPLPSGTNINPRRCKPFSSSLLPSQKVQSIESGALANRRNPTASGSRIVSFSSPLQVNIQLLGIEDLSFIADRSELFVLFSIVLNRSGVGKSRSGTGSGRIRQEKKLFRRGGWIGKFFVFLAGLRELFDIEIL
jgi:hypothetical protein